MSMEDNETELVNAVLWDELDRIQTALTSPTWTSAAAARANYRCTDENLLRKLKLVKGHLDKLADEVSAR